MCNPTISEFRRSESEHVLYEIEMFCGLAGYFESGEVDAAVRTLVGNGIVVRNAMIEAFQLHARQLIEFLSRSNERDSRASHFTKGPWRHEPTPRQDEDWTRFSQHVVHLSLVRATFADADRRVETRRIRRDLGAGIYRFLEAVDDGRVCEGFVSRARAALRASEPPPDVVQPPAIVGATEPAVRYRGGTATSM
jgi:hypothetical protein